MPLDNNRHAPRHAARTERGFSPDVARYSAAPAPRGAARPLVGEDPAIGEAGAPRPIGVDPAETGSFQKLSEGEGAVLTSRDNADEAAAAARTHMQHKTRKGNVRLQGRHRPQVASAAQAIQVDRKLFIGIAVAAAAVVVVLILGFAHALSGAPKSAPQDSGQAPQQAQVSTTESISYNGQHYGLAQQDGGWVLAQLDASGSVQKTIVKLPGTPVSLALYQGAFIIPENVDGHWNVMSYVMGEGAVPAEVVGEDGNPVGGEGRISDAHLDAEKGVLAVTTDKGSVDVKLD